MASLNLLLLPPPSSPPFSKSHAPISTRRSSSSSIVVKAGASDQDKDVEPDSFNPFGFVTNNPYSNSAIQLPVNPADKGNAGKMLNRIEDKGKDYGRYIRSGEHVWFVRETGSADSKL